MDKKLLQTAIEALKKDEKKRNFAQSYDLIVTLKDLNLKNPNEQVDFFATCKHSFSKKIKVAAIVGPELQDKAKATCDTVISITEFDKYQDKKLTKKLASEHNFVVGQADIMAKIAQTFGRVLGPRGKMPNPKLGTVLPAKGNIEPLVEKLQKTVRVSAKKAPMIQVKIGDQTMTDDQVIENALTVYDQIVHHLPKEKSNVKNVLLKLTMSKPVKVESSKDREEQ